MLLLPLGFLLWKSFQISPELLVHVEKYLLWEGLGNTVLLLISVLFLSATLGLSLAWIVARYRFFGRSFFRWALILPLALPAYVVAFVWLARFGQSLPFFQLSCILSFCLFPYIYLILLECFDRINQSHIEVAQSLGMPPGGVLKKIYQPMLFPSLMAGVALVGMETLADFGSVSLYNVSVLTTIVYRSWFGLQSLETAAFLAMVHIGLLLVFVFLTSKVSRRRLADKSSGVKKDRALKEVSPITSLGLASYVSLVWVLSFVLPVAQLLGWGLNDLGGFLDTRLLERIINSLVIASGAALITLFFALVMTLAKRYFDSASLGYFVRLGTIGYGIPGTVIAVGWMVTLGILLGSFHHLTFLALLALVLGLSTRFLSLAQRPLFSAVQRISLSIEETAKSSGASTLRVFRKIHFPLLSSASGIAFLFVFIDTLKEMPMTLLMRPYGWDTLSVRVYQFTSDGMWQAAAAPSLVLVLVSLLPLWFLRKQIQ